MAVSGYGKVRSRTDENLSENTVGVTVMGEKNESLRKTLWKARLKTYKSRHEAIVKGCLHACINKLNARYIFMMSFKKTVLRITLFLMSKEDLIPLKINHINDLRKAIHKQ